MSYSESSLSCLLQVHAVAAPAVARVEEVLGCFLQRKISVGWSKLDNCELATIESSILSRQELFSAEISFLASMAEMRELAFELTTLPGIFYEVSHPLTHESLGQRICYTPSLGIYQASLDEFGNQVFNENQLAVLTQGSATASEITSKLKSILGQAWDQQLEPLRSASAITAERRALAS